MRSTREPQNRLLLALPRREYDELRLDLETVETRYREVLVDDEDTLERIYFPNCGVISVLGVYSDGATCEMATVGREGMTGFQEILGARVSTVRLLTQIEGNAVRMTRKKFDAALVKYPTFRKLMNLYLQVLLDQVMLSGACNTAHSVKQRLARWLLMMLDRQDGDELGITQDLIAEMLSVHRPTATKALRVLQKAGLIRARRGGIEIKDREGLMTVSCECYQLNRARTLARLPKTYPG